MANINYRKILGLTFLMAATFFCRQARGENRRSYETDHLPLGSCHCIRRR